MKKFLVILVIFLTGCVPVKQSSYSFTRNYSENEQLKSHSDVYDQLSHHNIDSIPLEHWMVFTNRNDSAYIVQSTLIKTENENSNYIFIYTEFISPDTTFYEFKIRHDTIN